MRLDEALVQCSISLQLQGIGCNESRRVVTVSLHSLELNHSCVVDDHRRFSKRTALQICIDGTGVGDDSSVLDFKIVAAAAWILDGITVHVGRVFEEFRIKLLHSKTAVFGF